jgi:hypothetical protein
LNEPGGGGTGEPEYCPGCCWAAAAGAYLFEGGAPEGGALYGEAVRGIAGGPGWIGIEPTAGAGGAYWLAAAEEVRGGPANGD